MKNPNISTPNFSVKLFEPEYGWGDIFIEYDTLAEAVRICQEKQKQLYLTKRSSSSLKFHHQSRHYGVIDLNTEQELYCGECLLWDQ